MAEYAGYGNCLCWQKTQGDTNMGQGHPLGFFDIWDKKSALVYKAINVDLCSVSIVAVIMIDV